jgi:hypothetical protein
MTNPPSSLVRAVRDPSLLRMLQWRAGSAPRRSLPDVFPGSRDVDVTLLGVFAGTFDMSLDPFELLVLCSIERYASARRVLEIGTYDGGTTLNLAANMPADGVVITIDLPSDWDGNFVYDVPRRERNAAAPSVVGRRFIGTAYESHIRQVLGDSATLDWEKVGKDFDLAFIDANHSYDYVASDTARAIGALRPEGIVVWHDYGYVRDVSRAVDETGMSVSVIQGTRLAVAVKR